MHCVLRGHRNPTNMPASSTSLSMKKRPYGLGVVPVRYHLRQSSPQAHLIHFDHQHHGWLPQLSSTSCLRMKKTSPILMHPLKANVRVKNRSIIIHLPSKILMNISQLSATRYCCPTETARQQAEQDLFNFNRDKTLLKFQLVDRQLLQVLLQVLLPCHVHQ